jgi:hypothetical protein
MLTVRLDQFSSLEEFARGYRQHVTRTTLFLPTRLNRPEASLLLFRIEIADGSCAFRGEGIIDSYRLTPGGEQLGMILRLRRLDKASKELHAAAFAGVQEPTAPPAARFDAAADIGSLMKAVGAAADAAFDAIAAETSAVGGPAQEPVVISRNEGGATTPMRDDLRAPSRSVHEAVTRPMDGASQALVEAEGAEQPQSVGRMAVSRLSVDEYEARKLAMARVAAPPPVASLVPSSESSVAWSEAEDALDFEGIGSDLRPSLSVAAEPEPVSEALMEEAPLPPSPTLPPLEAIVVAPPQDAVGGGVTIDEVTFGGSSAYEMPVASPIEPSKDLDLDFDFTAVTFAAEPPPVLSGSRPALTTAPVPALLPAPAAPVPVVTSEQPEPELAPRAAAPSPAPAAGPSRLPPAPPPKSGPPVGAVAGAPATRVPLQMSKPIPKPTPAESEEKPGLFGWLRGKR